MASLRQVGKNARFLALFRFNGRQYQRALKTTQRKEALAQIARIEDIITLVERGRLAIPADVDPADFIVSDGRLTKPRMTSELVRLKEMFDAYRTGLPDGAKETQTISGEDIHIKHLTRHLGMNRAISSISLTDIQDYVAKRSQDDYRGKSISVDTIRKELSTFRLIWNWALTETRISKPCPTKGVKYPKRDAKPHFVTIDEIQRIVSRGGLTEPEVEVLWDSVFLHTDEINQFLADVRKKARLPLIYPLFVFAAHTGARRSELIRSRIEDFDFDLRVVHIREKKRSRSQSTTFRRVPMSQQLMSDMQAWFAKHPGGQFTIARDGRGILPHEATNCFRLTVSGTRWSNLSGFHVLRHSFASNAAAAGVDPGMIDSWMGHQTQEMHDRYRHLFPKQQQSAIDLIFRVA
mgnify:CR=1 FL=1